MLNSTRWLQDKTAAMLSNSERRSSSRFPIQLKGQYRLSGRSHAPSRTGLTLYISSGRMLIKPQCGVSIESCPLAVANEPLEGYYRLAEKTSLTLSVSTAVSAGIKEAFSRPSGEPAAIAMALSQTTARAAGSKSKPPAVLVFRRWG